MHIISFSVFFLLLYLNFSISILNKITPPSHNWASTIQVTLLSGNTTRIEYSSAIFGTKGVSAPYVKPPPHADGLSFRRGNKLYYFGGVANSWSSTLAHIFSYNLDNNEWTWEAGSSTIRSSGVYGTLGISSPYNYIGSRDDPSGWIFGNSLFIFGGYGCFSIADCPSQGWTNELWKYSLNTGNWTWLGGTDVFVIGPYVYGKYGTLGVRAKTNWPGGRHGSVFWKYNNKGYLMFGDGYSYAGPGPYMLDMWTFELDNAEIEGYWTWVGGPQEGNQNSICHSGIHSQNRPGGKEDSVGVLLGNELWIFGGKGFGCDDLEGPNYLNDLFSVNMDTLIWSYHGGGTVINEKNSLSWPGSRIKGIFFTLEDHLILYGGYGYPSDSISLSYLSDLWSYDINEEKWILLGGHLTADFPGDFFSPEAWPPGLKGSLHWVLSSNEVMVFGGGMIDSDGVSGDSNALWMISFHPNSNFSFILLISVISSFLGLAIILIVISHVTQYSNSGRIGHYHTAGQLFSLALILSVIFANLTTAVLLIDVHLLFFFIILIIHLISFAVNYIVLRKWHEAMITIEKVKYLFSRYAFGTKLIVFITIICILFSMLFSVLLYPLMLLLIHGGGKSEIKTPALQFGVYTHIERGHSVVGSRIGKRSRHAGYFDTTNTSSSIQSNSFIQSKTSVDDISRDDISMSRDDISISRDDVSRDIISKEEPNSIKDTGNDEVEDDKHEDFVNTSNNQQSISHERIDIQIVNDKNSDENWEKFYHAEY